MTRPIADRIDEALSDHAEEIEGLQGAVCVGWILVAEYSRQDTQGVIICRTKPPVQQSWTSQGYLSWAMEDLHQSQPRTGGRPE